MSRIETKRPKRIFPALDSGDTVPFDSGHARAIARRMAFEGAALLARSQTPGSPSLGDLAEDDICPLARRRTWTPRFIGKPIVAGLALALVAGSASAQATGASPAAMLSLLGLG